MTESSVISLLNEEIEKTLKGHKIEVIQRDTQDRCSGYIATIVVIAKEILPKTIFDIQKRLQEDGDSEIKVIGTQKDLREIDFEILKVEVEIEEI